MAIKPLQGVVQFNLAPPPVECCWLRWEFTGQGGVAHRNCPEMNWEADRQVGKDQISEAKLQSISSRSKGRGVQGRMTTSSTMKK